MNKQEIIAFGVPEDKIQAFQAAYWKDLHKVAERMAKQQAANESRDMLEAIASMLRLIPDPVRLRQILNNVNRHYAQYLQDERDAFERRRKQEKETLEGKQ